MIRSLILMAVAGCTFIYAIPFGDKGKGGGAPPPVPFLPHGWGPDLGWGSERPAYDINPHFGFRQYSEMRYEPLTTPFTYSTQLSGPPAPTQPLAPIFKGEGPPYSPNLPGPIQSLGILNHAQSYMGGGNSLYDDGYMT